MVRMERERERFANREWKIREHCREGGEGRKQSKLRVFQHKRVHNVDENLSTLSGSKNCDDIVKRLAMRR